MIRAGNLNDRTTRVASRVAEVADRLRPERHDDPLGIGLTYPVMFIAYDVERGIETPLSGVIHEDDPNLVVVSLVAEAIAQEDRESLPGGDRDDVVVCACNARPTPHALNVCGSVSDRYPAEIVTIMEVWKS